MGVGRWAVLAAAWWIAGCAEARSWVVVRDGLTKLRPGIEQRGPSTKGIQVALARNECEGAQLSVAPGAKDVRAAVAGLAVDGLRVRLYREEYLPVLIPSNTETAAGLWPDALVPEPGAFPASSSEQRPLVVYVELCAAETTAAGSYQAKLTLTSSNRGTHQVPLSVQVERFAIPATSSLPNTFGMSRYSVAHGHRLDPESPEAAALLTRYANAMLEHRLSPFGETMSLARPRIVNGEVVVDFSGYDRDMGPYFEGNGTPGGARFTTAHLIEAPKTFTDDQRTQYYAKVREHFREKGWKAQLFYYAKDEPRPSDVPIVLEQSKRVRKAGQVPVLITAGMDPKLTPAADIACPVINCFYPRSGVSTCKQVATAQQLRKAMAPGAQVWWYQSCMSHGCDGLLGATAEEERAFTGWASYMVDHSGPRNRAMGAMAYLAGIEGELYWDTVFAYQEKDPWQDQFAFGGNGDGTLFYPGTPARIGGTEHLPVASLRLKHLRDGLEDYEYLRLLESLGERDLAHTLAKRLVKSGYEIREDPAVWHAVRRELAEAIRRRLEYAEGPSVGKEP